MRFPSLRAKSKAAFTLTEMMVASAIMALISVALVTGAMAIQRAFYASILYARNQGQQLRVLDYISMDCRRATDYEKTGTVGNEVLTFEIPSYYNAAGTPRMPYIVDDIYVEYKDSLAGATPAPIRVTYQKVGTEFIRTEVSSTGAVTRQVLATDVLDFSHEYVEPEEGGDQVFQASISFVPTFAQRNREKGKDATKVTTRTLLRNLRD